MNPDQSSLIWVPIACKNISRLEEQTTRLYIYSSALQTRFFLLVCFVALRPKSTAMVMAGRPVFLTTLFPGQA